MNKKIAALAIASLLAISMVSGGVWAYFSDIETASDNTLTAGTLNMVPATSGTGPAGKYTVTAGGDGVNGNVVFQKLYPGDSGTVTWVLTNSGDFGGAFTTPTTVTFTLGAQNEIKTAAGDTRADSNGFLDENMLVTLRRGIGTDQAGAEANFVYILGTKTKDVAMSGLEAAFDSESLAMGAPGGNDTIVYQLSWNLPAGSTQNIYIGDTARIDITFTLSQ